MGWLKSMGYRNDIAVAVAPRCRMLRLVAVADVQAVRGIVVEMGRRIESFLADYNCDVDENKAVLQSYVEDLLQSII